MLVLSCVDSDFSVALLYSLKSVMPPALFLLFQTAVVIGAFVSHVNFTLLFFPSVNTEDFPTYLVSSLSLWFVS